MLRWKSNTESCTNNQRESGVDVADDEEEDVNKTAMIININ